MRNTKRFKACLFLLIFATIFSLSGAVANAAVVTPTAELSKDTKVFDYTVTVNGPNGQKLSYNIFAQKRGIRNFISVHGCAECSLTTVLSAHTTTYANYTPYQTSQILERKMFGTKIWKQNYKKSLGRQMPVSLYGISTILKKLGINNRYIRTFKNASAVKSIENHLKQGKPVIIEVNNHKQLNGKFRKSYNQKWTLTRHTMVLLGMTDTGKAIIADSANRDWAGTTQRVKFARVSELVQFMIPCKRKSNSYYYQSVDVSGGYILVK